MLRRPEDAFWILCFCPRDGDSNTPLLAQAAEDTSSKINDKIVYAEKAQEMEAARVKELQGRVDEVKKSTSVEMDGVQGAGHAESMDMEDVRVSPSRLSVPRSPAFVPRETVREGGEACERHANESRGIARAQPRATCCAQHAHAGSLTDPPTHEL